MKKIIALAITQTAVMIGVFFGTAHYYQVKNDTSMSKWFLCLDKDMSNNTDLIIKQIKDDTSFCNAFNHALYEEECEMQKILENKLNRLITK
jgi:hypothetical protein